MREWIVIDGGSKDKTKDLISSLKNQKNKPLSIKYVYQKNSGKHVAVNECLEIAWGTLESRTPMTPCLIML